MYITTESAALSLFDDKPSRSEQSLHPVRTLLRRAETDTKKKRKFIRLSPRQNKPNQPPAKSDVLLKH